MASKQKGEGGMTLIELIVGLAISSVVSLMAAQFFSAAARLYRTSTEQSSLQKDGERVMSLLTRSFMNTEELFYCREGEGFVLILGRGGEGFEGQVFYCDGQRLYADLEFSDQRDKEAIFTSIHSRGECQRLAVDDYLITNKIKSLEVALSEELTEKNRTGAHTFKVSGSFTIEARVVMQYRESKDYELSAKAVPRRVPYEIFWM